MHKNIGFFLIYIENVHLGWKHWVFRLPECTRTKYSYTDEKQWKDSQLFQQFPDPFSIPGGKFQSWQCHKRGSRLRIPPRDDSWKIPPDFNDHFQKDGSPYRRRFDHESKLHGLGTLRWRVRNRHYEALSNFYKWE